MVSAKMGGRTQRSFEHIIWMAHTAVRKNALLKDWDILLVLMLTRPTCDRSLVPSVDYLVCGMDVTTTCIAWSTMPSFKDMVFQCFKENFNIAALLLLVKLFYMPEYMYFYMYV